jgi:hypothetical protein
MRKGNGIVRAYPSAISAAGNLLAHAQFKSISDQ